MAPHAETRPSNGTRGAATNGTTNNGTHAAAEKPKVMLIPFDPESEEQCERLRLHRVACGWKADKVPGWRECQREGTMSLHWAVSGHLILIYSYLEIAMGTNREHPSRKEECR